MTAFCDQRLEVREPTAAGVVTAVGEALRVDLGIGIELAPVASGTLPRFELTARRLVRRAGP